MIRSITSLPPSHNELNLTASNLRCSMKQYNGDFIKKNTAQINNEEMLTSESK